MRLPECFITIPASALRDAERRRWYSFAAESCIILTERGRLLEPFPIFGPTSYRLLGCRVDLPDARAYARARGHHYERAYPPTAPREVKISASGDS